MLKTLNKKPILKAHLFTVYEDEIELPSGEKRKFQSAIRKPSVTVIPIDNEGNIYLVNQYRYLHKKRLIEAVAGIIDEGEESLAAAKRELKEELGIVAGEWRDLGVTQSAGSIVTWDQNLFLAQNLKFEEQNLEDTEDIIMVKMPLEEAVEGVMRGEIHTSSTISGILMVDKILNG